jgi:hypothetical protein
VGFAGVKHRSLRLTLDHDDGIDGAGEAERAGHLVDEIFGLGFAGVVHDDDWHAEFDCEVVQAFDGLVVCFVLGLSAFAWRADHLEHINRNEGYLAARGFGFGRPFADVVEAALIDAAPLGHKHQTFWPFHGEGREQFRHAGLDAAKAVFEGQIQNIALHGFFVTEHIAFGGRGDGDIEQEPGFPDLRLRAYQGNALVGDEVGDEVCDRVESHGSDILSRGRFFPPFAVAAILRLRIFRF